jgi:hypothetical protein
VARDPEVVEDLGGVFPGLRSRLEVVPVFTHDVAARETPDGNHHGSVT